MNKIYFFIIFILIIFLFFSFTNSYIFIESLTNEYNTNVRFNSTGQEQNFIVPENVTKIKFKVVGGGGGGINGGNGAVAEGTMDVTPGEKLFIYPGGKGQSLQGNCGLETRIVNGNEECIITGTQNGGFNGGGKGAGGSGGGGGGASHIAKIPGLLKDLKNNKQDILIVAGGGGGSGPNVKRYIGSNEAEMPIFKYKGIKGGDGGIPNGGNGNASYGPYSKEFIIPGGRSFPLTNTTTFPPTTTTTTTFPPTTTTTFPPTTTTTFPPTTTTTTTFPPTTTTTTTSTIPLTHAQYVNALINIGRNCGTYRTGNRQLNTNYPTGSPIWLTVMIPPNNSYNLGQGISYKLITPSYPQDLSNWKNSHKDNTIYFWAATQNGDGFYPNGMDGFIQQPIIAISDYTPNWYMYIYSGMYKNEQNISPNRNKPVEYISGYSQIGPSNNPSFYSCNFYDFTGGFSVHPQYLNSGALIEMSLNSTIEQGGQWFESGTITQNQSIKTLNTTTPQIMEMQYKFDTSLSPTIIGLIMECWLQGVEYTNQNNWPADPYFILLNVRSNNNNEPYTNNNNNTPLSNFSNDNTEWAPANPLNKYCPSIAFDPNTHEPISDAKISVLNGSNVVIINPYYQTDEATLSTTPVKLWNDTNGTDNGIYIPRNFMKKMLPYIKSMNNWNISTEEKTSFFGSLIYTNNC